MALKIGLHLLYGPFPPEEIKIRKNHSPVVFVIVAKVGKPWSPEYHLLHLGYSSEDGLNLSEHSQKAKWSNLTVGIAQAFLLDVKGPIEMRKGVAQDIATQLQATDNKVTLGP